MFRLGLKVRPAWRQFRTVVQPRPRTYATYNSFKKQQADWNRRLQWGGTAVVVGGIVYVSNLDQAPYSGRSRFMIVPRVLERRIGESGYQEMMQQYGRQVLPPNHRDHLRVKEVMKRILNSTDEFPKDVEWAVHVINAPNDPPNAFVLPNGKVFVFSSMLSICGDDDGLATVLSHEAAHQLARHTAESLSKAPVYFALTVGLSMVFSSRQLPNLMVKTLLDLPASRESEREADYIGLMLMSRACYNPDKAPHLWERMVAWEKKHAGSGMARQLEFLSTHPGSEHRIENLKQWLPEAHQYRERANCGHAGDVAGFFGFGY